MSSLENVRSEDLIKIDGHNLLLNVSTNGVKVTDWAEQNKQEIERLIQENGALLIRGLKILSSKQYGVILKTLFGDDLLEYTYRSTPRTELRGNVYTATEYHSDQVISQHNENAYSNQWAMRLGFLCMLPSEEGGETPICDSREIYQKIPVEIRDEFEAKNVMYIRNYSSLDLPWTEVFQTENKKEVEEYCTRNQLSFEWLDDDTLRTTQVNNASAIHPTSNEKIWFNQAHLFHVSNLPAETKESLISVLGENGLPRNSCFGDGSAIDPEALQIIRDIYEESKFSFPWQKHDLMLLDNMLYAHGRMPFSGQRKILVGMARPYSN